MKADADRTHTRRRGGVYIAVLATVMLVSLIGLSAMMALRSERLRANATVDSVQASLFAQSGAELAVQLIASDPNWRTTYGSGTIMTNRAIDDGRISVTATDPIDGNLGNRPTDPVVLRATAKRGIATKIVEVTLDAGGPPIDALAMAVHTAGDLRVANGDTLTVTGAPASTNTTLTNVGTVAGDAQCLTAINPLNVTGTLTLAASPKAMPSSGILAMYSALGTPISPGGNDIQKFLLAPGVNPWGAGNPDGVYVLTVNADITLRNCRIVGTLVINNPGKKVTIKDSVLIQPARPDYPALIIDSDVVLQHDVTKPLSEATIGVNCNPTGVPYLGVTDADTADTYPCEIGGLVHVRGILQFNQAGLIIRGAVICESAALSKAVEVANDAQVFYDPALYSKPPMGYTKFTTMSPRPGSWKRAVSP